MNLMPYSLGGLELKQVLLRSTENADWSYTNHAWWGKFPWMSYNDVSHIIQSRMWIDFRKGVCVAAGPSKRSRVGSLGTALGVAKSDVLFQVLDRKSRLR